jgi:hypothetical protein
MRIKKLGSRESDRPEFGRGGGAPSILKFKHQLDFSWAEQHVVRIDLSETNVDRI